MIFDLLADTTGTVPPPQNFEMCDVDGWWPLTKEATTTGTYIGFTDLVSVIACGFPNPMQPLGYEKPGLPDGWPADAGSGRQMASIEDAGFIANIWWVNGGESVMPAQCMAGITTSFCGTAKIPNYGAGGDWKYDGGVNADLTLFLASPGSARISGEIFPIRALNEIV